MKVDRKILLAFGAGFLVGGVIVGFWTSRGDAMDCVVENMRGQPSSMQRGVAQWCIKQYGMPD